MNINTNINANIGTTGEFNVSSAREAGATTAAKCANGIERSAFSITEGSASADEIAAAAIPESALRRDDGLGMLVAAAFNLPPPPMPASS